MVLGSPIHSICIFFLANEIFTKKLFPFLKCDVDSDVMFSHFLSLFLVLSCFQTSGLEAVLRRRRALQRTAEKCEVLVGVMIMPPYLTKCGYVYIIKSHTPVQGGGAVLIELPGEILRNVPNNEHA